MNDDDPKLLSDVDAEYLKNKKALLAGWKLVPDRSEQIAKMYGVDTSKLEPLEAPAQTIPLIDRYHEFFMGKAKETAKAEEASEGESIDSDDSSSEEHESEQDSDSSSEEYKSEQDSASSSEEHEYDSSSEEHESDLSSEDHESDSSADSDFD